MRAKGFRYLLISDMKATTKKAMPAQNQLPVRNKMTSAIMAAGRINSRTFAMSTMMTMPMMTSRISSSMP